MQDTFLVAAAKLHSLRDPGKLRAWLYAVARNEGLRRLRAGTALSALEEAADLPTQTAGVETATERAELRELVRAAIDGLAGTATSVMAAGAIAVGIMAAPHHDPSSAGAAGGSTLCGAVGAGVRRAGSRAQYRGPRGGW